VAAGLFNKAWDRVLEFNQVEFGSGGSVSRRFREKSKEALEEFEKRKLNDHRFVALFVDGKEFSGQQMVIVLGVTDQGNKIPLGVIQTTTENAQSS